MKGCLDLEKKYGMVARTWAGPRPAPAPGPLVRTAERGYAALQSFSFQSDALSCHCKIYENTATHTHCGNIHGTIWLER